MGRKQIDGQLILNASLELFVENGFKSTTMTEIAERAGITKRTLYKYYENKDQVFDAAVKVIFDMIDEMAVGLEVDLERGFEESTKAMITYIAKLYCDQRFVTLSKIVLSEIVTGRELGEDIVERYGKFEILVADLLGELKNHYFPDSQVDLASIQHLLMILIKGYILYPQVIENKTFSAKELEGKVEEITAIIESTIG